jgi:hypothetical protein
MIDETAATPPSGSVLAVLGGGVDDRRRQAADSSTDPRRLAQLALDPDEEVREGVAWNARTLARTRRLLAADESLHVRAAVAVCSATPVSLLETLAIDPAPLVRLRAVLRLPPTSWERWLSDPSADIRLALATTPNLPAPLLAKLATDGDRDVRTAVARHENTPIMIAQLLAADPDPAVRAAARCRFPGSDLTRERAFAALHLVPLVPDTLDDDGDAS